MSALEDRGERGARYRARVPSR